ncbi:hypothetical protein Syun_009964 [Stephania yunnanensis]|uniref:Uncharacterized protein n=1 Tax=Stephania yunnanensis TaxID=152371 RepID=A0AAP0KGM0_9MAGN
MVLNYLKTQCDQVMGCRYTLVRLQDGYKEKVYPENKLTCPPQINNTSQSSSSLKTTTTTTRDENREVKQQSDHYLKRLNRASHKISKPIQKTPTSPT